MPGPHTVSATPDPTGRRHRRRRAIRRAAVPSVAIALAACGQADPAPPDGLAPTVALSMLPDVPTPEDLIAVPDTSWVLTSSMAHGPGKPGRIGVVDIESGAWEQLWPAPGAAVAPDRTTYADCPGPPPADVASPHGINLVDTAGGGRTLLAVNHGGRESVEAFEVDTSGDRPALTWTGCVTLPDGAGGNGVVGLPGGGLAVSNPYHPASPDKVGDMFAQEPNGDVRVWRPDEGWTTLPGSELAGPNGIETSPDGTELYLAVYARRSVVSLPVAGGAPTPIAEQLPFLPDNLFWDDTGSLLVTGPDFASAEAVIRCSAHGEDCPGGFTVSAVDVAERTARTLYRTDTPDFTFATVAAAVGDEIWVGSLTSDAIARVTGLPPTG